MKALNYRYYLRIRFDSPVTDHCFTVRCTPPTDGRQEIICQDTQIFPREFLCRGNDSFGNAYIFGRAGTPHTLFEVVIEGKAKTGLSDSTEADALYRIGMYSGQTGYTMPGEELTRFFHSLSLPREGNLKKSLYIMDALRTAFTYVSGKTDITTTAEKAWGTGCGVCQDYAHIMIALCRMAGIQARYVAGMLIGEGASHAWVEVADSGRWYGLDPTNGVRVMENHIKISHGRDYGDCLLNQGVFTGNARQHQSVSVIVEEAGETQ